MAAAAPLVSVIVPSYMHRPYLADRFASIFSQSYPNTELIVLDDASTDGSQDLLQTLAWQHPFKLLDLASVNSGSPYRQWLKGLTHASGRYVWIAESDDSAEPGFLQAMVATLEQQPEAAFAVCAWQAVDEAGQPIGDVRRPLPLGPLLDEAHQVHAIDRPALLRRLAEHNPIENVSTVLFRTDVLRNAAQGIETFKHVGDWMVYLRALHDATAVFVDLALAQHRTHPDTTRVRPRSNAEWAVLFAEMQRAADLAADVGGLSDAERTQAHERLRALAERQMTLAARLADWRGRLVIYGAGAMGRQLYGWLREARPDILVPFFVDALARSSETPMECCGLPVLEPEILLHRITDYDGILIASVAFHREIFLWINQAGLGSRLVSES